MKLNQHSFKYIKISPKEHAEKMNQVWDKRESKLIAV